MFRKHGPLLVGTILIIGLVTFVTLYRSSPGELSKAHHGVAGSPLITDCRKCHSEEGINAGCLSCHTEILNQRQQKKGFHDQLTREGKTDCSGCHSEHNGTDFSLVNEASWENKGETSFQHLHTTYTLTGAHKALSCQKCHTPKNHPPVSLPKFPEMVRQNTFLGLSQTCTSCHTDPHAGGFASQCTSCHDQTKWRPVPHFKHETFFPLLGVHANLKCSQCHSAPRPSAMPGGNVKLIFGPVKGKRCTDCHTSPHFTKWVESCESCHKGQDKSWASASSRMTKAQHSLTGFRLAPPHQKATCASCHSPEKMGKTFVSRYPNPRSSGYKRFEKNCESCHQDEHKGQFTAKHRHCIDCHSRSGFIPTTFSSKDHSTYPLIGAHAKAACHACHTKDPAMQTRRYTPLSKQCSNCHRDVHYGQFRDQSGRTTCETCHQSTTSWSKLVFNHDTQSRFKLDKAHKNVACKECHPVVALKSGTRLVQYKPLRMRCQDCHEFEK